MRYTDSEFDRGHGQTPEQWAARIIELRPDAFFVPMPTREDARADIDRLDKTTWARLMMLARATNALPEPARASAVMAWKPDQHGVDDELTQHVAAYKRP